MKNRVVAMLVSIVLAVSAFSFDSYAGYTTLQHEIPPTQFQNDEVFSDDAAFPYVKQYGAIYVPLEMFKGLSGVIYYSDDNGGSYISSLDRKKFVSFSFTGTLSYSSENGLVNGVRIIHDSHTYVAAEYCARILGIKYETAVLNDMTVVRISDNSVTTTIDDVIKAYVKNSDAAYTKPDVDKQNTERKKLCFVVHGGLDKENCKKIINSLPKKTAASFFVKSQELQNEPLLANYLLVKGQSVGIDLCGLDEEQAKDELCRIKELLLTTTKLMPRTVLCDVDENKLSESSPELYKMLNDGGFAIFSANVEYNKNANVQTKAELICNTVISEKGYSVIGLSGTDSALIKKVISGIDEYKIYAVDMGFTAK